MVPKNYRNFRQGKITMIQDNSIISPLKELYVIKYKELCTTFDEVDFEWLRLQINNHIKNEDLYGIEIVEMSNNSASSLDETVLNAEIKFNNIKIIYHFVITFEFNLFEFDTDKEVPYATNLKLNSLRPHNGERVFYLESLFEAYLNEMFSIKDKMLEYKFKEYRKLV